MGIFFTILTQPIFNALVAIYNTVPGDFGIAIIILTVIIKLILWPLTGKSLQSQKAMQAIQPKITELKEKFKDDKEGQAKATMALYKEEKVNPFSSCLPLIIQLPILLALFNVLRRSIEDPELMASLYSFVSQPEVVNNVFIGIFDLSVRSIPLALMAGAVQYVQAKMLETRRPPKDLAKKEGAKDEAMAATMAKSMTYTMPLITVVFGATLPGGVMLYWLSSNVVSVIQQYMIFHKKDSKE
ncbi:membrane protein insertase YidC [Candidatus Uhrbacteria bacterium]|jgi:YidC/Oxa1 family membrane protein insertase|nr:membrane protein insertase YidC [Candidatus Uhrbacteria bacterium]